MRPRTQIVSRLEYCQYLQVSQINYTLTNYADMLELLKQGKGTPIAWSPEKEKQVVKAILELVPSLE